MAYDLADSVPLAVDIKDAAGAYTNATGVTLTITLPDGTTVTPPVTNPPASTGKYRVTYVAAQEGRHVVRWVTTVPNTAHTDVFDVREAASPALLSLADEKEHLEIPASDTTDDDELRDFIEAATEIVEQYVGPIVRRTHTVQLDPHGCVYLTLPHTQVLEVTALTLIRDGTTPLVVSDLNVDTAAGVISRKDGAGLPYWPVNITYKVGRPVIKRNWSLAARMIVKHNWSVKLGNLPSIQGDDRGYVVSGSGYLVPYRALSLLEPDSVPAGFA